jgi:thioredoxin-dependent peroxiredoxin
VRFEQEFVTGGFSMAIAEGQRAPDFELPAGDGSIVKLADLRGKTVVLYFYPKDDTPGCTREACSFRDNYATIQELGVTLLGVSPDKATAHQKFTSKYELPFPLLSDEGAKLAQELGVWVEKVNYGKKYMGIERSTFVIDGNGVVRKIFRKVKVDGHTEEVLAAVRAL